MGRMNRRDFIQGTGWALAATGVAQAQTPINGAAPLIAASRRVLGKTGLTATLLGMGTGTRAWNGKSAQNKQGREPFVKAIVHAYERGLRYYDMADMYGAHDYVKEAMKQASMKREELMLLSKTVAKDAVGVRADVERFLKELDTDYLDIVLLHCMTEGDWPAKMAPRMEALSEAKAKGKVKAVGVSCHGFPPLQAASETPWVEVMLSRINPFGTIMDAPPEQVIPVLKKAGASGKGMLGMKILGEGKHADRLEESVKFVMDAQVVQAFTIGFLSPGEIDDAIAKIERVLKA